MNNGWRTAIIQSGNKLSLSDSRIRIENDQEDSYLPITQLRSVVIASNQSNITSALLSKLAQSGVSVIFCDGKHLPIAEITPFSQAVGRSGNYMDQACWTSEQKAGIWEKIARSKVQNQIQVLRLFDIDVPPALESCVEEIVGDDTACKEGEAAAMYFRRLFGMTFRRHAVDDQNGALNYGYSILLSTFCQIIRQHGFATELGIHHHSRANPFNLACDLMEPFRPLVDRIVFNHFGSELTFDYKKELIAVTSGEIVYKDRVWKVDNCMEQYFLDVIRELNEGHECIGGFEIV